MPALQFFGIFDLYNLAAHQLTSSRSFIWGLKLSLITNYLTSIYVATAAVSASNLAAIASKMAFSASSIVAIAKKVAVAA
jgi:hypothetical protein